MVKTIVKAGLSLGCCCLALHASAAAENKTWRIGVADHVYPFSYVNEKTGEQTGFDVDMAHAICHDLQLKCEIVPLRYLDLRQALLNNNIQMVINGWRKITQGMQSFAFTDPYYRSQIIFVTADSSVENVTAETIGQRKIGALAHSGQALLVKRHYLKGGATLHEYPSSTTLYQAVQKGEVDVVCVSGFAGYEYLKHSDNKNLRIVGIHRDLDPVLAGRRVAVNEQYADKVPTINRALMNIKADGRYQAINLKYFEFMIY